MIFPNLINRITKKSVGGVYRSSYLYGKKQSKKGVGISYMSYMVFTIQAKASSLIFGYGYEL